MVFNPFGMFVIHVRPIRKQGRFAVNGTKLAAVGSSARLVLVKKDFKRMIRAGSGQLATEAKLEEYAKLMANKNPRQPKPTGFTETKAT